MHHFGCGMNWIKGYYMIVKVQNETFWVSTYSMEIHSLTSSSFIICLWGETFGSRTILFCFVLFLFLFFVFFASENSTPLISNGAPLSLFYYTDDGGHYVIDNFGFPCNSVKNLIPIWNFTNTFIQDCKIIWEFQIRWGGTSLLRPLWRSWRYLKAYSLMSNRGRFQNFKKLIFFPYFRSPPLRSTIPKRN